MHNRKIANSVTSQIIKNSNQKTCRAAIFCMSISLCMLLPIYLFSQPLATGKNKCFGSCTRSNVRSDTAQFVTGDQTVSVRELGTNPSQFSLFQNYPNPFNPTTQISYTLAKSGFVTLKVFDVLGREIQLLVNAHQEANKNTLSFDAGRLASGIIFYQLKAGNDFTPGIEDNQTSAEIF